MILEDYNEKAATPSIQKGQDKVIPPRRFKKEITIASYSIMAEEGKPETPFVIIE